MNAAPPQRRKRTLEEVVRRVHEVSSIPSATLRVLEVVQDESSSAMDLKRAVESEPVLSARVLRVVNAAAFGLRYPVNTIHSAICLLGFHRVRNLAVTASVAPLFRATSPIGPYCRSQLWRHLVSVAVLSRMIAVRTGLDAFEEAYLCGLLHDLGVILMDQFLHEDFVSVMKRLDRGQRLHQLETEELGFDHGELGAEVAAKWRLPESSRVCMRYHHASGRYHGPHASLAHVVEVADFVCTMKGIGSTSISAEFTPEVAVFRSLQLDRVGLQVLWEDADRELEKHRSLVEI